MNDNIEERIAEIEERQTRFVLADSGTNGWINYIQSNLLEERQFEHEVIAQVIATLRREFEETVKRVVSETMAQRVRGTYDPKANASYAAGDMVACDGASFVAKFAKPGPCPGAGWQLVAKQGSRGIAGPKGDPAGRISGWKVDAESFVIQPIMSDGSYCPPLELRSLFVKYNEETIG
jgi:hypothetical protein